MVETLVIYSTLWFIGIELKPNNEAVDLNLTDTILSFKDMSKFYPITHHSQSNHGHLISILIFKPNNVILVYKQAGKVLISCPQFDAKYVKRFLFFTNCLNKIKIYRKKNFFSFIKELNLRNICLQIYSNSSLDRTE